MKKKMVDRFSISFAKNASLRIEGLVGSSQLQLVIGVYLPCTTNQVRALTFEGAFELHKNLAGRNKIGFETFDKTKKKNFTENKSDDDKDQALEYVKEEEKNTELKEDMILWRRSIYVLVRLWRKLKFQDSGKELPKTFETVRIFT